VNPALTTKEEFCRFCRLLYDRHLVGGVGGNISARSGENIWLTPSGFSLRDVEPGTVVTVNSEGHVIEGENPTKDAAMHLKILRARPETEVVLHVHGAAIVAASTTMNPGPDTLPPLTPGFVYYAHPLPMLPFLVPGTQMLADAVAEEFLKRECRAVLLQNHGLVTVGKNFQDAFNVVEEIDEAARVFVLTHGKSKAIPSEDVRKIR
jgi:ribulose-5-phosphate 4-epimerase/fuculose-1-phosphate aldolase